MDEIIATFNRNRVRYLLIGAQAARLLGNPRYSFDWDLYIPPRDRENIRKINELLPEEIELPLLPLGMRGENFIQTYQTKHGLPHFYLIGFPPFEDAEKEATEKMLESGTKVKCVSAETLLRMKEASNRPHDQSDILFLRALVRRNASS